MMAVSSTVSTELKPSPTVIVTKGEGATFSDFSNGQEPPPHIIILNQDGSLFLLAKTALARTPAVPGPIMTNTEFRRQNTV